MLMVNAYQTVLLYACMGMIGVIGLVVFAVFTCKPIRLLAIRLRNSGRLNMSLALLAIALLVAYGGTKPIPLTVFVDLELVLGENVTSATLKLDDYNWIVNSSTNLRVYAGMEIEVTGVTYADDYTTGPTYVAGLTGDNPYVVDNPYLTDATRWMITFTSVPTPEQPGIWTDPDTGYAWAYRINNDGAEIVSDSGSAVSPEPSGSVAIPLFLGGKPVTRIGALALDGIWHVSGLTNVIIPSSVTSIGFSAFGNSGLTNVTIPPGVTNIEDQAFVNCPNLTNVTFESNAPSMGDNVFVGEELQCHVYVRRDSTGWGVDIPGTWNGIAIDYLPDGNPSATAMIANVTAKQRYPWNGLVDITCNVSGMEGTTNELYFAMAAVDLDSGNAWYVSHFWIVRNGVNTTDRKVCANGDYRLLWDAGADFGQVIYSNMAIRITFDSHQRVQLWKDGPYWATTNIGAGEPWEYGYYFWWGDTVGYTRKDNAWVANDGSSSNFSFRPQDSPVNDKTPATLEAEGWTTADAVLLPRHDAAQVQWGGGWRMPTYLELIELNNNCRWTWTTMNGVNGYVVRGWDDYASESIFLPATGFGNGTTFINDGSGGAYWSSTSHTNSNFSRCTHCHPRYHEMSFRFRYDGVVVRPVQMSTGATMTTWVALTSGHAAQSSPFVLDTIEGTRTSDGVETLSYSSLWGGDANATVTIAQEGVTIVEDLTGQGEYVWHASSGGTWVLTHTTYTNGIVGTVETATFNVPVPDLTIDYDGGPYMGGNVTINGKIDGWTVYYTTDGSTPTAESTEYTGPFVLASATTVKAFAVSNTGLTTGVCEKKYDVVYCPRAESVAAKQRYPWNGKVDITCNVVGIIGETNGLKFVVTAVDVDSGSVHDVSHFWIARKGAYSTTGGEVQTNGKYRLVWDAQADLGQVRCSNMVVRVALGETHRSVRDNDDNVSANIFIPCAGVVDSIPFKLDTMEGSRASGGSETLTYSSLWDGENATVAIAQNGEVIAEGLGEGELEWNVMRNGTYVLTHTTYTNGVAGNVETATFNVTRTNIPFAEGDVTVTGHDGKYDGVAHGIRVTVRKGIEDVSFLYASGALGTTCPTGEWTVEPPKVTDVGGMTVWCEISAPGYITQTNSATVVVSKREVTLTSDSASKPYDGTELVKKRVMVSGYGFAKGEGATYSFTGTQTDVGSSENTFTYMLNEGTKAGNYDITTLNGELTVTKANVGGGIVEPGDGGAPADGVSKFDVTVTYDGLGHTIDTNFLEATFSAAMVGGATLSYALDDGGMPSASWTTEAPAFTNVGEHVFWYKAANQSYNDFVHAVKVTILPKPAEIHSVTARQRWPWNGKVDIAYEVVGDVAVGQPEWNMPFLSIVAMNRTDGTSFVAAADALSGDTSDAAGKHHVTWDLDAQGIELLSTNVTFLVAYLKMPDYCVIDLSGGTNAASYGVSYLDAEPEGGFTNDLYRTTKLAMRLVAPGTFTMGDRSDQYSPPHNVTLTQPFYCAIFETTQKQWELVKGDRPSYYNNDLYYATRPVETVSYEMIRGDSEGLRWPETNTVDDTSFLGALRSKTGLAALDLLTEAQWEYACRAGTTTDFNNGKKCTQPMGRDPALDEVGRYDANGGWPDADRGILPRPNSSTDIGTAVVGSYLPNAWGLYDMHGNVWELCLDLYGELSSSSVTNPVGSSSGTFRSRRGGTAGHYAYVCVSSYRNCRCPQSMGGCDTGFRIARTLSGTGGERGSESVAGVERAGTFCVGESAAVSVDSRTGIRSSDGVETLAYSSLWDGSENATVTIAQNGEVIAEGLTGESELAWNVTRNGTYVLTHTTYTNGVEGNEETVTFVVTGKDEPFADSDVKVTGYSGVYDGAAHGVDVSVRDGIEGVVVRYASGALGTTRPASEWADVSPMLLDVGSMTVWCEISAPGYITQTNSAAIRIIQAINAWIATPSMAGWTYGQSPSEPNMGAAKFGTARVTYGTLGSVRPTEPGEYVAVFTVAETVNWSGLSREVPFKITAAEEAKLGDAFDGKPVVIEHDDEGGWIVTITNDIDSADLPIEIPANIGNVMIDLNGHDLTGNGGALGESALPGEPAIRIVLGDGDGEPTVITIVNSGDGATVKGGEGAPAIEVADGAQDGVLVNIGAGVTVQGGDDYTPAIIGAGGTNEGTIIEPSRIHIPGEGTVTTPKTWKTGQKVTWKAKAAKGSVFAHWEGELVDSLGLSRNELRNPSLQFVVPEGFKANQISAVFIAVDDDRFSRLGMTQTEFELKSAADSVWVTDDSESYVTASVSGLPSGLKFNKKTMRVTGTPTKSGVWWVQIKAKNASGYQWAENVKIVVGGNGKEAKEPKLTRTAYYPLSVVSANTAEGTVSGTGVYMAGKKASISAKPAKGYVFAGWYLDPELTKPMTFASGDFRKASQSVIVPEARYLFARFVGSTTADDPVTGLAATSKNFRWCVGVSVPDGDGVTYVSASLPTVSASGLPTGVKFDAVRGCFMGVPTKAGEYSAVVTVKNVSKATATLRVTIKVEALPAWAQGTFNGATFSSTGGSPVQGDEGNAQAARSTSGQVTLTVDAKGKISGKLIDAGGTWTLSAVAYERVEGLGLDNLDDLENLDNLVFHATVIGKNGKKAITNEVTVALDESARSASAPYRRGVVSRWAASEPPLEWTAWQNLWKTEPWKNDAKAYAKVPKLVIDAGTRDACPYQGTITLKFGASGAVTAGGKFVTGQDAKGRDIVYSASCSAVLVPDAARSASAPYQDWTGGTGWTGGTFSIFNFQFSIYLYFPPKVGKFDGYAVELLLVWDGATFTVAE